MNYPHFASRLFNTPLLISEQKLYVIEQALAPRLGITVQMAAEDLQAQDYRDRAPVQVVSRVAIIDVMGTLVYRASGLDAMSGLTSYEQIRSEFRSALRDPEVASIVLRIDSPGGEVNGIFDLQDEIYQARGGKPIIAFVDGSAHSGALLLASACDEIIVTQTSSEGSLGVVMAHADISQANEARGIVVTHIFAGKRKIDGTPHAPLSPEAMARFQADTNHYYDMFVDAVSRNLGLAASVLRATEADVYVAPRAITIGFAHSIQTFDRVLQDLRAPTVPRTRSQGADFMSKPTQSTEATDHTKAIVTADELDAVATSFPKAAAALRSQGAEVERSRVMAIHQHAEAGQEGLVRKLVKDGSDELTALKAINQDLRKDRLTVIQGLKEDSPDVRDLPPAPKQKAVSEPTPENVTKESAKAAWDSSGKLQSEFEEWEDYHGFLLSMRG